MMLDRDTLEFVRTGLDRYPNARETVGFFEQMIHKSVAEVLQQRKWRTFRPSTNNKGGLAIGKAKGDTFLHAWLEGSTKRQGNVRIVILGIYWEDPVVAAVSLMDENWKKLPVKPPRALNDGIKFNSSDQSLRLAVGNEFEPETDFKRLLDPLEDAIESDA
jgi:hypothetical protein